MVRINYECKGVKWKLKINVKLNVDTGIIIEIMKL